MPTPPSSSTTPRVTKIAVPDPDVDATESYGSDSYGSESAAGYSDSLSDSPQKTSLASAATSSALALSDVLPKIQVSKRDTPQNPTQHSSEFSLAVQQWQTSWQRIQAKLRSSCGEEFYQHQLLPLKISRHSSAEQICLSGTLRLDKSQQERLRQRLLPAWKIEHPAIPSIKLDIQQSTSPVSVTNSAWDPILTFHRFVQGRGNAFALAAAQQISATQNSPYNPLYVCGGVGLGKTHLLTAIAHERTRCFPEQKILLMTAESFMRRFVNALRKRDNLQFKQQFDKVDLLLIDDVHFLSQKTRTQEEFFHIINDLIANHVPVVVTSDRPPHDIEGLDIRVISRLASGLVTEIHPPDSTMRQRFLSNRIAAYNLSCDDNVIPFIADNLPVSIRELEGAIKRMLAFADLMQTPIDMTTCRSILRDLLQQPKLRLSMHAIQQSVAAFYALPPEQLLQNSRRRVIARPRQIAMYLCKQLTPRSLPEIGRQFGGRDHTTVLHAIKRIEALCQSDTALAEDIRQIKRLLQG